ncbi:MAG TPA: carboxypeptidase M32 [candidate division Zixibacteria bacterium]|jgi:carboxypeptidase Taq
MTPKAQESLDQLKKISREISILGTCGALLGWDERTHMPPGGAEFRAEQSGYLAGLTHKRLVDPRIGELLEALRADGLGNGNYSPEAAIVREIGRAYDRATKIPQSLVEEITKCASLGETAWAKARKQSDYSIFKPWLTKMIGLKKQEAEAVGYEDDPYDALLDDFEPGATVKAIEAAFTPLRVELVKLLDKIKNSQRKPDVGILDRRYPVDKQEDFGRLAAKAIGFDFERGRLDVTVHPFCTGIGPGDTRITTRYHETNFTGSFFGILHESGHGIYDQGLNRQEFGNPLGDAISLGIHESQSRMWENQVGRSRAFWEYFYPTAQKHFPEALGNVSLDAFYFAINDVRPSFIRTESDEATYNLHIMLRFEMERAIFSGDLTVDDVPAVWNEKFTSYFGITPSKDSDGCLQDVHWSAGLIGYFPTYTLGNLYSAQFFAQAKKDVGDMYAMFRRGEFAPLKKWLNDNIHHHGQRYRADELVQRVTGKPLSHEALLAYMTEKFGKLYSFA